MAGNLEPAVRTPDVLVAAGYENGLPNAQVLERTAAFPFYRCEPCGPESPRRFLLPLGKLVYSPLAAPVKEASAPVSGEDCGDGFAGTNVSVAAGTFDQGLDGLGAAGYQPTVTPEQFAGQKVSRDDTTAAVLETY